MKTEQEKKLKQADKKAKKDRVSSTKTYARLWNEVLKNKQLGVKFLQKEAIGEVIVDFYCPELKMIIQIDGNDYDGYAVRKLKKQGYHVLKYASQNVLDDLDFIHIHLVQEIAKLEGGDE